MIALVDANNFYVSCERAFDWSLKGKAVAVMSNNDGSVIARSNEIKAMGIKMATPTFMLRDLVRSKKIILRSGNSELYADMSRRVMSILATFVDNLEQYSIDEAFLYYQNLKNLDLEKEALSIRKTILKGLDIPCSVGFAKTKTLAKLANHIAKKSPSGVFIMPEDNTEILKRTPVEDVWKVGKKSSLGLHSFGIKTAYDLVQADTLKIRNKFSVNMQRTCLELQGKVCIDKEDEDEHSKSIICFRSFGKAVSSYEEICESVAYYTSRACQKLRKEGLRASGANLQLAYYKDKNDKLKGVEYLSINTTFRKQTDDTNIILSYVAPKIKDIFIAGKLYKKSGIMLWGLENGLIQQDLFAPAPTEHSKLFKVVDALNAKYGTSSVFNAGEGIEKTWLMKRESLSPQCTTNWKEILSVKY